MLTLTVINNDISIRAPSALRYAVKVEMCRYHVSGNTVATSQDGQGRRVRANVRVQCNIHYLRMRHDWTKINLQPNTSRVLPLYIEHYPQNVYSRSRFRIHQCFSEISTVSSSATSSLYHLSSSEIGTSLPLIWRLRIWPFSAKVQS